MIDSGGVQKDACFFQASCVTIREETEWIELGQIDADTIGGVDTIKIGKVLMHPQATTWSNIEIGGALKENV